MEGEKKENKILKPAVLKIAAAFLLCAGTFLFLVFSVEKLLADKEPRIFGSTYMTMNNPYFTELNESIREVVIANGDILITRNPAQSQERQNEQILDMIDEGMTVLFANAVDGYEITPALEACREAGVAVFVVDTDVEEGAPFISVIQSDNYRAGALVAEDLMKKKPEGADIAVLYHYNVYSMVERRQGFLDTLKGHPEYRIIAEADNTSEIEVSTREMNRILAQGKKPDVVFGVNDPTALGCLAAIQMNDLGEDILIYGVDGSIDGKVMVETGKLEGTAVQYPVKMGETAAELAYAYLAGKEVPASVDIEVEMLTRSNINSFDVNEWQ